MTPLRAIFSRRAKMKASGAIYKERLGRVKSPVILYRHGILGTSSFGYADPI